MFLTLFASSAYAVEAQEGTLVPVEIKLESKTIATPGGVTNWELNYDKSVLEYDSIVCPDSVDGRWEVQLHSFTEAGVKFSILNGISPFDESGALVAIINLRVKTGAPEGEYLLSTVKPPKGAVPADPIPSSITIVPGSAQPPVGAPGSGDLDGNGSVTVLEARAAVSAVLGLGEELSQAQTAALDMNGDNKLTMADVTRIIRRALGLP
jgi:hypothetical protein